MPLLYSVVGLVFAYIPLKLVVESHCSSEALQKIILSSVKKRCESQRPPLHTKMPLIVPTKQLF